MPRQASGPPSVSLHNLFPNLLIPLLSLFHNFISPSLFWSFSAKLPFIRTPFRAFPCPSHIFHPSYVHCQFALQQFRFGYDVYNSCLLSHPLVSLPIASCYTKLKSYSYKFPCIASRGTNTKQYYLISRNYSTS